MRDLIAVVMLPLMLLNFLGGIVSGIWLAILGEWWAIGYGILGLFSHFLIGLALMPGLLLAAPAALLLEKNRTATALPFLFLSQLYTYAVIGAWCMFVFYFFTSRAGEGTTFPLLIWSYGVAIGPLAYMAGKEQQGGGGQSEAFTTFFTQIGYILIMILRLVLPGASFWTFGKVFAGTMVIAMVVQTAFGFAILKAQRDLSNNTGPFAPEE